MKFHSTVLFVKDISKSKEFYTKIPGFTIEHDFGKNVILSNGLTIWEILPDHIITRQLETSRVSNRFEMYFEAGNIEKIFNDLENAGVKFFHKIHEEPWGQRTFRFFDPDGHLIEVGESLEIFVNNMKNNGLTIDQISNKSGIPVETLKKLIKK